MNIFYLDHDPVVAAKMHCDIHSSKMISESVLMLCNAHRYLDGDSYADKVGMFPMGYKTTHAQNGSDNQLQIIIGC